MNEKTKVLVVDDEHAIVRALTAALEARGYQVTSVRTGHEALDRTASSAPDAIILDLGLPDLDGLEVCRRIRLWSEVPILVLTAEGSDDVKVKALDEGADDYVTKPFSTPELLARLRVALRHHRRANGPDTEDEAELVVGQLTVDLPHHEVRAGDVRLDLTPKEFGFLAVLARHPGRVLTHRMILQQVWGEAYGTETQYLRVYASQLRKKLAGTGAPTLVTEPGVGYRLVEAEADGS
ncbi:response regulator transcription factor [Aquihabitans sp. G128]|uniref:response regulator transcription factor n=1 Tax=Aquihabitans sp. G128 TaxID=2849779 RepID=UPI001C24ABF2|nr:response regulator transcription factor [Aquihabitans sp. G128]QXC61757.1 response regulator transcription factor [Aquihabitans sp. G128]